MRILESAGQLAPNWPCWDELSSVSHEQLWPVVTEFDSITLLMFSLNATFTHLIHIYLIYVNDKCLRDLAWVHFYWGSLMSHRLVRL